MKNYFKSAFTLAEALITLAIIGVVAAMTLPAIIGNVTERINSERQANIVHKVTQAMEQMRAHGLLNTQYSSTDAFVDELQKYLKVSKRCDSAHIADCWPTKKVTTGEGEELEVKIAKKGRHINYKNNITDNVGLVLADGASIIMTYDTSAKTIDVGDEVRAGKKELPVGGGKMKEFPYSTDVTASIDFVMDVNGAKGPNSEKIGEKYYDIRSFKSAAFSKGCDFTVGKMCVRNLGTTGYGYIDCRASNSSNANYKYCSPTPSGYWNDYWAGAKKACADIDMTLATLSQLETINNHKNTISDAPKSGYAWAFDECSQNLSQGGSLITFAGDGGTGCSYKRNNYQMALCVSR